MALAVAVVACLAGVVVAALPTTSSASTSSALVTPAPLVAGAPSAVAAPPVGAGASGASPAVRTPSTAARSTPTSPSATRASTPAGGTSTGRPSSASRARGTSSAQVPALEPSRTDPKAAHEPDPVHRLASGRTYELHTNVRATPQYRGSARPLVIMLHGFLNTAEELRQVSGADSFADAHGFAVAYGVGVDEAWNAGGCCGEATTDDVAYVRQIVADVARHTPVDRSRIYVWGFSNGAMLAARVACQAPGLVAAVGMVGGQALVSCPRVRVNLVHIHGTADTTVPWRGGWSDYLKMSLPDGETEAMHFAPGSTISHILWNGGHIWPWWGIGALWDFSAPQTLNASADVR
ncbi:PHB depolymerase family esterase [Frankia sp. AiPa1]|uniref:alpha/beta hydrolase family esterase n=1 Tax=Frankia sp. AiPa1 TaxID=573492 RepID=UPI00202B7033|nr:PHB depolymerase family esterase [Frankia sp. AiPa1]MCL9760848.1 poly(3-hydroxybutyrate) depolymerase [Frankia sp. AiPa1]